MNLDMVRCVLCRQMADPENPLMTGAVYAINPQTMRLAWMHGHCMQEAVEQAEGESSTKPEFENRADEWMERSQQGQKPKTAEIDDGSWQAIKKRMIEDGRAVLVKGSK